MLRDHLGSVRAAFDVVNDSARIVDVSHYYPFGLHIDSLRYHISPGADENEYAYNGKEWQNEGGFNQYDYGARMYDPAVGRWWVVDPLSASTDFFTPYVYVGNNPINNFDPNGLTWIDEDEIRKIESEAETKRGEAILANVRLLLENGEGKSGLSEEDEKEFIYNEERAKGLTKTLENIQLLREDSRMYGITTGSNPSRGFVIRDESAIWAVGPSDAVKVHEIDHIADLLRNGGIDRPNNWEQKESLTGLMKVGGSNAGWEEMKAYQTQWAFDPSSMPAKVTPDASGSYFNAITNEYVADLHYPNQSAIVAPLYPAVRANSFQKVQYPKRTRNKNNRNKNNRN